MTPHPKHELSRASRAVKKHAAKQAPTKHAKKAAQKSDKKHASKKHAKKHGPPPHEEPIGAKETRSDETALAHEKLGKKDGKQLRRVYEHLARVRVLLRVQSGDAKLRAAAERLAALVTADLEAAQTGARMAAELTRAAEHIAFAGLGAVEQANQPWSAALASTLETEYRKLREDGELRGAARNSRGERASALRTLHELMAVTGEDALGRGNYACALESARAMEALCAALEHDDES